MVREVSHSPIQNQCWKDFAKTSKHVLSCALNAIKDLGQLFQNLFQSCFKRGETPKFIVRVQEYERYLSNLLGVKSMQPVIPVGATLQEKLEALDKIPRDKTFLQQVINTHRSFMTGEDLAQFDEDFVAFDTKVLYRIAGWAIRTLVFSKNTTLPPMMPPEVQYQEMRDLFFNDRAMGESGDMGAERLILLDYLELDNLEGIQKKTDLVWAHELVRKINTWATDLINKGRGNIFSPALQTCK
ncbi:MAG: hypothetical protein JSS32_04750 [Verrucomicrobia bacterium]|nr:hypothetical protein [Verrucomicrobiota bacterium]